jgi:hypothetical protein
VSSSTADALFLDWRPTRMGGPRAHRPRPGVAVVVSIVVHALLIAAAGRMVWTRLAPPPDSPTEFVWLGERPVPAVLVEPPPVPVEAPAVEREQAPPQPAVTVSPPVSSAAEPPSRAATQPDNPSTTAGDSATEPRPIRGTNWDEERRRAIGDALARQARDTDFSAFTQDDRLEALPAPPEPQPARSIFDSQSSGGSGGPSLMQPGRARTKFGRSAREWCNALTGGGFSLFGFATLCTNPPDYVPSGLFPEVMPEWLKRMPECTETRPLGPLLGESSEFPTIKCRMVPKEAEEPLSEP